VHPRTAYVVLLLTFLVGGGCAGASCESRERAARLGPPTSPNTSAQTGSGGAGGGFSWGQGSGGDCGGDSLCGNEVHAVSFDVPNVYFVLDRSGSMLELVSPGVNRYYAVRRAAVDMIKQLGPLINVGAALFPVGNIDEEPCNGGDEVMAVRPGDPIDPNGEAGPTTLAFQTATKVVPNGGTPISKTLETLQSRLKDLEGRTIVLLLTDGGPNCNSNTSCDASGCMPVIEGDCPPQTNCCAKDFLGGGPELCVDQQATVAAIQAIADLNVDVYVIGITGSDYYGAVLDDMAIAGGKPKEKGDTKYHKVEDVDTLQALFASLAADAISCDFELKDPPPEQGKTNVYLDCDVLPLDPIDGWAWNGGEKITLYGEACIKLKTGKVTQVKIITGCPTEEPK
jgi:hypothetical protein